jgi:Cdc6-like AAA superfamily ATPase
MITAYIFEKLMDVAIESAKSVLKESNSKLLATRNDLELSIKQHLQQVSNWSARVSFNDLKKPKPTLDIFIELDLFVIPKRMHMPDERVKCTPLVSIFNDSDCHFALLGEPGAGKTTSMKYLCQGLLLDEGFLQDRFSFPILVRFSDLNNPSRTSETLIDHLYNLLGLNVKFSQELLRSTAQDDLEFVRNQLEIIRRRMLVSVLEELNVLLVLDGFDELTETKREEAIQVVSDLATRLSNCTMIITSRTGEFTYNINNMIQYELSSFNAEQISRFANRWLNDEEKAGVFVDKIHNSPFADTAIRPLTLAHLCALYDRVGDIPDKPKTVYRKVVNLLLEEWDQQRAVKRVSKYSTFDVDRKFEFLSHLAYDLTVSLQKTEFSKADLEEVYEGIYLNYDLPSEEAHEVANELETHTGLFVQAGYDRFAFAHKSLQEYLSAEHLVRLPSIPDGAILLKLPHELAIAVTISSRPSDYAIELIINRFLPMRSLLPDSYISAFFTRLFLEKPDFKPTYDLCISLLMFYSKYVSQYISSGKTDLVGLGKIADRFESTIKRVMTPTVRERIKSYYKVQTEHGTGGDILCLTTKTSVIAFGPRSTPLPSPLYVKKSLLDDSRS